MEQAYYDLEIANISMVNGFHEWAAYQAEQAAEKALKAVIVSVGWRPPKMHKLGMLFGMCNQASEKFRTTIFNFKHLESFTFISRYPFLIPGKDKSPHNLISHPEAANALEEAQDIVDKIKGILSLPGKKHIPQTPEATKEAVYTKAQIDARIREVKDIFIREFNPTKIILFGSFAREYAGGVSGTMDVLIVANTDLPFIERIVRARELTRGGSIILEPLVYTEKEFKQMIDVEGEGFIESALLEGIVIYDSKAGIDKANL
jgi:HEPN domain-containing protein/predicted nucleotidyltransferase